MPCITLKMNEQEVSPPGGGGGVPVAGGTD